MFEKILSELKTKYKNLGLSETILKVMAETLAKTVETEEQITDAVAGVEGQMKIYQSFADQNRTLQTEITNLKKSSEGKKEEEKEKKEGEEKKESGEVPEWAKGFTESIKTLTESLTAIQQEKAQQTNAQKLQSKLDELKVSKSIQALIPSNLTFENDEAIEAYANEMKVKSDAIAQEFGNAALGGMTKPTLFSATVKEGEVSPEVQAIIDSKKS